MQVLPKIVIRNYQKRDFKEVIRLWEITGMAADERRDNEDTIDSTLQQGGILLVMVDSDCNKVVGTSWITNDGRRLYLHHFGIDPKYQNLRLGYKLGLESLKFAVKKRMQIKLEVEPSNEIALKLYMKLGFKPLGDYNVYIIRNIKEN